jgi:uncharacterized protein
MSMNFFPKTSDFFSQFEQLAQTVTKAGGLLAKIKLGQANVTSIAKSVQKLELEADEITHQIAHDADSTFITPIDREDIHALADHLDNLLDLIENVATGLTLYAIKKNGKEFYQYTELIGLALTEIEKLIFQIRFRGKDIAGMRTHIDTIHAIEKKGDVLTRQALTTLFTKKNNAVEIIKWKYVYDNLEMILDECEKTADCVDEIIIKNF